MPPKKKPTRKPSLKTVMGETGYKQKKKTTKKQQPLWDLYRDGITQTMIGRFLGCRERFRLSAVEGWTVKGLSIPLEFGNVFHSLLELYYGGAGKPKLIECVRKYINDKSKTAKASCEEIERLGWMTLEVFLAYIDYWSDLPTYELDGEQYFDKDLIPVLQEEVVTIEHYVPQRNTKLKLTGRIDGGFRVPWDKSLSILENKTKGQYDVAALELCLKEDLQIMMYSYMLEVKTREKVRRVLYNLIRRPQLRPKVNESVKDFVERLRDDISKRQGFYFDRIDVELGPDDVDIFVAGQLNLVLTQIIDWWESIKHDPFNPWVDENGNQNELHFRRPMGVYDREMYSVRGEFSEIVLENNYSNYERREHAFPELVD